MTKSATIIMISFFLIINVSCTNIKKSRNVNYSLIKQSIDSISSSFSNYSKDPYLVYPKFTSFAFDNYLNNNNFRKEKLHLKYKQVVLETLKWNDSIFNRRKVAVNKLFHNVFSKELQSFSTKETASIVFYISGVDKKMFFVEAVSYNYTINTKDFINNKELDSMNIHDIDSYVILLEGNKIDKIIKGNIISFN